MMLYFLVLVICGVAAFEDQGLLVSTHNGDIQGKSMEIKSGNEIRAFLGIRYAKPPIGNLRFMQPVPFGNWTGIQQATEVHPVCTQQNSYSGSAIKGEEDCLFLNVYTPKKRSINTPLPVMMYIHYGGFIFSSGNSRDIKPDSLLNHDLILVVINYRLGAFGFLSTTDDVVPGNNGLKDQSLALKWIQEHIEYFGGDPNQVTIFGESAGAASSHYHVLSPLSKDLFRVAISQGGNALAPWALSSKSEAYNMGRKLATLLDCPTESSREMIECLQTIEARKIVEKQPEFLLWDIDPLAIFTPVIEIEHAGAFITEHPEEIIKSDKVNKVTWVNGLNAEDGAIRSCGIVGNGHFDEYKNDFDRIAPLSLMYKGRVTNETECTARIREYYFGNGFTVEELTKMYSDGLFFASANRALKLHMEYNTITLYNYLFDYRGSMSITELYGDKINDYGVCHGDELMYLFPMQDVYYKGREPTKKDNLMTNSLTQLWSNFAIHIQPTNVNSNWPYTKWEPVQTDNLNYLAIGGHDNFTMHEELHYDRMEFWNSLRDLLKPDH